MVRAAQAERVAQVVQAAREEPEARAELGERCLARWPMRLPIL